MKEGKLLLFERHEEMQSQMETEECGFGNFSSRVEQRATNEV